MKQGGKSKKNGNKGLISNENTFFTAQLMEWNRSQNKRQMPWKGEKDIYKIWLSEIILQQTRVEQGLEYYNRFIDVFPTIHHLSKAEDQSVFKLWEGLGYYSRCKNLLATARFISDKRAGKFPDNFDEIKSLKGIGPYTASAIASFGYNLPYAVVDGNVFRVISRFFGISTPIDTTAGKKFFSSLAQELLHKKLPAQYNQAIMDFGAIICKPKAPLCSTCVLKSNCKALQTKTVDLLPVKEKKLLRKKRWLYYYLIISNGKVYIKKRMHDDIWQNLHEFVLLESDRELTPVELSNHPVIRKTVGKRPFVMKEITKSYKQQLTHVEIEGRFIEVGVNDHLRELEGYQLVHVSDLSKFAFPKFILSFLEEKNVNLK
jgi:A/G-specific adenine glycosylase